MADPHLTAQHEANSAGGVGHLVDLAPQRCSPLVHDYPGIGHHVTDHDHHRRNPVPNDGPADLDHGAYPDDDLEGSGPCRYADHDIASSSSSSFVDHDHDIGSGASSVDHDNDSGSDSGSDDNHDCVAEEPLGTSSSRTKPDHHNNHGSCRCSFDSTRESVGQHRA